MTDEDFEGLDDSGSVNVPVGLFREMLQAAQSIATHAAKAENDRAVQAQLLEKVAKIERVVCGGTKEPGVLERLRHLEAGQTLWGKILPAVIGAGGVIAAAGITALVRYGVGSG